MSRVSALKLTLTLTLVMDYLITAFINAFPFTCSTCKPGESVEENANVVVKLLIRRPECFGPALRGEGGQGLLVAMKEAIKISEDPALDLPKTPAGVTTG